MQNPASLPKVDLTDHQALDLRTHAGGPRTLAWKIRRGRHTAEQLERIAGATEAVPADGTERRIRAVLPAIAKRAGEGPDRRSVAHPLPSRSMIGYDKPGLSPRPRAPRGAGQPYQTKHR